MKTQSMILAAIAALTLTPVASAHARDAYHEQVANQLANFIDEATLGGNFANRGHHIGKLSKGQSYVRAMTLEGGEHYVFGAACDRDCGNVRLKLIDENNRVVSDSRSNRPVAVLSPRQTRVYRIQVDMTGCREDECHFGVGMVAK